MPNRKRHFTKPQDVHQYINDLEDVYGMEVEVGIEPIAGAEGTHPGVVKLRSIWRGDTWSDGPLCEYSQVIALKPQDKYVKTMLNALIEFTYQCVEAHLCALEQRN